VKALLSLDRQMQTLHQDSSESSASATLSPQQQLGVWQVFQPGVGAEGGSRSPGGSGTAAPATIMSSSLSEAMQLQQQQQNNSSNNNNTRKRRASARLVTHYTYSIHRLHYSHESWAWDPF
jgi:hypothetical protein